MKLTEMTNEQAMNAVADLIDPVCAICSKELLAMLSNKDIKGAAKKLLREHQQEVVTILAVLDGVKPEEYRFNPLTLIVKVVGVLNDPEVVQLFTVQLQSVARTSSGAVSAGIGMQA